MWDTLYVCTYLAVLVLLGLTYTLYIGGRVYVQGTRNNLYDGWGWADGRVHAYATKMSRLHWGHYNIETARASHKISRLEQLKCPNS